MTTTTLKRRLNALQPNRDDRPVAFEGHWLCPLLPIGQKRKEGDYSDCTFIPAMKTQEQIEAEGNSK